jgi:hypothetical protein
MVQRQNPKVEGAPTRGIISDLLYDGVIRTRGDVSDSCTRMANWTILCGSNVPPKYMDKTHAKTVKLTVQLRPDVPLLYRYSAFL